MDYLKDEQYYTDLYDLLTIKRCLRLIEFWQKVYKKHSKSKELKGLSEEKKLQDFNKMLSLELYFTKISEYKRKEETISEWVEETRTKQDKYDNTPKPTDIHCSGCNTLMRSTHKHLEDYTDKPLCVLFFFDCPKCKKRRSIYDDGKEYVSKLELCPKCSKKVKTFYEKKKDSLTTTTKCTSCKYKDVEVYDWKKREAERNAEEKKNKELLRRYRKEFCLSDKEGKEGVETMEAMEVANVVRGEEMQKYDNPIYERSLQLKKTNISDLEKLLTKTLEREKYTKLSFGKPEIGQYVIVSFTVQDLNSSRRDRVSVSELEKLIKDSLDDTNWRLLSNSVMYRLGYLEGRLKGHEREEDMLKLAGKNKKAKPKSKIDEEKRSKYNHHHLVQLARLFGQHDGIENIRKRRLINEPEGFFLEASEGPYNCGICGEGHNGDEIWWNLEGLRCADCWRNIQEKVIPPLQHRHRDKEVYFQDWQVKSDYGVHPATRGKLRREGVLIGRDLKKPDGTVYCTVYLISENKEFLKEYPKLDSKIRMTMAGSDGKEIEL